MKKIILFLYLLILSVNLKAQNTVLSSVSYDKEKDKTLLSLIPQGSIAIPGKWKEIKYNSVSRQFMFSNSDSTILSVAKTSKNKYPFKVTDNEDSTFVNAFYKWESEYRANQGFTINKLNNFTGKGYVVWQLTGIQNGINNLFLFGIKNGWAVNLSISSKRWNEEDKKKFLIALFLDN